jgi:hypothetical protein
VDPANWFILQRDQVREGATSTTPPGATGLPEALLSRPPANLEVRREFFSNRVVDEHNRLPDTVTLTPGSLSLRESYPRRTEGPCASHSRSTPGDFFMYKLLAVLNTRSDSLILIINNSYNFAFIRIMFIYLLKIASES